MLKVTEESANSVIWSLISFFECQKFQQDKLKVKSVKFMVTMLWMIQELIIRNWVRMFNKGQNNVNQKA